jgi:hypothetical protein
MSKVITKQVINNAAFNLDIGLKKTRNRTRKTHVIQLSSFNCNRRTNISFRLTYTLGFKPAYELLGVKGIEQAKSKANTQPSKQRHRDQERSGLHPQWHYWPKIEELFILRKHALHGQRDCS